MRGRIAVDVDAFEEEELSRLETGLSPAEHPAPLEQSARAAAQSGDSNGEVERWDEDSASVLVPLGHPDGRVLAPYAIIRTACLAEQVAERKWRVVMGEPVAHFLAANGPPQIVAYNFNKFESWVCPVGVQRHACIPAGTRFAHHDFADVLELTALGKSQLRLPECTQPQVYRLVLACSGASYGMPKQAPDPTNCARVCCGGLGSACTCKRKRHQSCAVRVRLTATPALISAGKIEIEMCGSHVPDGETPIPPPLNGLRIDPHLKRQLVTLCKSSKHS